MIERYIAACNHVLDLILDLSLHYPAMPSRYMNLVLSLDASPAQPGARPYKLLTLSRPLVLTILSYPLTYPAR